MINKTWYRTYSSRWANKSLFNIKITFEMQIFEHFKVQNLRRIIPTPTLPFGTIKIIIGYILGLGKNKVTFLLDCKLSEKNNKQTRYVIIFGNKLRIYPGNYTCQQCTNYGTQPSKEIYKKSHKNLIRYSEELLKKGSMILVKITASIVINN